MNLLRRIIGVSIVWPWTGHQFASKRMTPRFNKNGKIYMLLCDDPNN